MGWGGNIALLNRCKRELTSAHPKDFYELLKSKNTPGFIERDGQAFIVLGEVRELSAVKLEPQSSPWLDEVGVTLAPSILIPCLPAGVMVKIDRLCVVATGIVSFGGLPDNLIRS